MGVWVCVCVCVGMPGVKMCVKVHLCLCLLYVCMLLMCVFMYAYKYIYKYVSVFNTPQPNYLCYTSLSKTFSCYYIKINAILTSHTVGVVGLIMLFVHVPPEATVGVVGLVMLFVRVPPEDTRTNTFPGYRNGSV